jgi:hypothetical protein
MRIQHTPSTAVLSLAASVAKQTADRKLAAAWDPGYVKDRSSSVYMTTSKVMDLINKKFPRWSFEGAGKDGFSISTTDEALGGIAGPLSEDVSEAKQIEAEVKALYPEATVTTDHVDNYFYVNVSGIPIKAALVKAAWTEEEVLGAIEDAAGLWGTEVLDVVTEMPDGRYKIGPVNYGLANRLYRELEKHTGLSVESDEAVAPTLEDTATVYVKIKAATLKRVGVIRRQAPKVDHQEIGPDPDPTLMVRTPGVGTITFDTTMGETMVSSLKASKFEVTWTRQEGGRQQQGHKEFDSEEAAKAFVADLERGNKHSLSSPFENIKTATLGDQANRFEVWWQSGDDEIAYAPQGFATKEEAEAYAVKKRLAKKYPDWGIKDKRASVIRRRQK